MTAQLVNAVLAAGLKRYSEVKGTFHEERLGQALMNAFATEHVTEYHLWVRLHAAHPTRDPFYLDTHIARFIRTLEELP